MTTTSTYIYEVLTTLGKLGNLQAAKIRLGRILTTFNPVDILLQSSQLEQFLTNGLRQFVNKPARITLIKNILRQELYGKNSTNMFLVIFEDLKTLRDILQPSGSSFLQTGIPFLNSKGITFTFGGNSIEHIFRNYSTGAARMLAEVFKQYAHNNHLLAQVLRDHTPFVGNLLAGLGIKTNVSLELILETISTTTSKIPDLTINILDVPDFNITFKGVNLSIHIPNLKIPVTFDSKVFKDPIKGISKAFNQQLELFFSDRMRDIVLPMLNEFTNRGLTRPEKREFLEKYIPLIFRHYVFVPKDFHGVDELSNEFTSIILNSLQGELESYMGKSHPDLAMVKDVLEEHVMDFFGDGEFILKESLMTYAWQIGS